MPAPTNSPVISSIPLYGPSYIIGEVTNHFQPTKIDTWDVVIPASLVGNEAIAGYAAFSTDGVTVTRGVSASALVNLVGFFANYTYWEGDAGSNPYTETLGGTFTAPVLAKGSIYVYNGTAISLAVTSGIKIVVGVTSGTPAAIAIGSVVQGSPVGSTLVDISSIARVKTAQTSAGLGCLIQLNDI